MISECHTIDPACGPDAFSQGTPHQCLTVFRGSVGMIPTPYLSIDVRVVQRNLQRMQDYVDAHGISLRPHTKTHKSTVFGRMQLETGSCGLTVAKAGEAEVMAGICDDILVAYPAADPLRAAKIARIASERTIRVAIDSSWAAKNLDAAAKSAGSIIGILVDYDVGMGRTGTQSPVESLELAQLVDRLPGLRLDGMMIYPGQVWDLPDQQTGSMSQVSGKVAEALSLWRAHGLDAGIVSGGSTPSAFQTHVIPEVTEIRPGTYIFNDMNTVRGGFCELDDCAACIVATVVSVAVSGQVVVDSGNKTLSMDRCIPALDSGHGHVVEYPDAVVNALSEEHGEIDVSRCESAPRLGDRISIIPNHVCPVVNLHDRVWLCDGDGEPEPVPVEARGRLF